MVDDATACLAIISRMTVAPMPAYAAFTPSNLKLTMETSTYCCQLDQRTKSEQNLGANELFASVSGVETYSYCDVASLSAIALVLQRRAVAKLSAHGDFPARSECMCLDEHHPMFLQMFPVLLVSM